MIWVRGGPTDRPRRGIVIVIDKIEVFIMERARAQLLELGFDHDTVERALRHADVAWNGRFDTSVESLVEWMLADQHSRETGQPRSDPKSRVRRPPGDLGGLDGVFEREKEQLDEFATLVQDGLNSVEALVLLSNEIETCARRMVERKRLNVETEDDILEDFLHGSNLAHVVDVADEGVGSAPRLTKKTSAPRARHATYAATDAINAINVIKATGMFRKGIMVNHYLTSATAWFIRTNAPYGARFMWRDKPMFDTDNEFDTKNAKAAQYMRFSCGITDWRQYCGTAGV